MLLLQHLCRSLKRCCTNHHKCTLFVRMCSSAVDEVVFEKIGSAGVITLNRPKALNALNLSMIRTIYPQMQAWEDDPSVKLVVIKASGEKSFCAGGDVLAVAEAGKKGESLPQEFFKEEYMLNYKIGTYRVPYIALIDGIVMGGGVGISVHGRFQVATEKTMFAMPETAIGLFPDVGGAHFLPRLTGSLGMYLALSGFRLRGRNVHLAGVATHFVQADKVVELEKALFSLPQADENSVRAVLDDFQKQSTVDKDNEFVLAPHMDMINKIFSGTSLEEIYTKLEKDGSDWSIKQLDTLKKMSPTSMKVTIRQLLRGKTMNLRDCLQMEYRLSQRFVDDHDYYEGVRAVLVDRDNKPQWKPAQIEHVTEQILEHYFSPLPPDRELVLPIH